MSSKNNSYKNMMYEQQVKYLPAQTIDNLVDLIENKLKPKKYAVILHDKDTDDNGTPKEEHIHAMMSFENAHSLASVAKQLGDKPQYIEAWKGNSNNGYAYLIHKTDDAKNKYQYNPDSVIANFDYKSELQKIALEVTSKKQSTNIKLMLDALLDGTLSKSELESRLTGSQYGRYKNQIENVWAKRLENLAEQFRKEMAEQGKQVNVLWIYGSSGVGKTSLAIEYAKKANQPYYITGSSRDIFQNYTGEHTLIMDELRPNVIPYQDLLRITDPFGNQTMAPSRYHDKALACDLIIITTPYNPQEFYAQIFGDERNIPSYARISKTDTFEQLLRRLTLIIEMDDYYINAMEFDSKCRMFNPINSACRKNKYSSINRPATNKTNTIDLFNSMFDD